MLLVEVMSHWPLILYKNLVLPEKRASHTQLHWDIENSNLEKRNSMRFPRHKKQFLFTIESKTSSKAPGLILTIWLVYKVKNLPPV